MSYDVELLVTFTCAQLAGVAAVARRFLPAIRGEAEAQRCPEAIVFLETFGARSGPADPGPKNGITSWVYGGNYTRPLVFAEVLRPFWESILRQPVAGGPHISSHIIVIYQFQDAEQAEALEIYLDLPEGWWQAGSHDDWPLVIRERGALPLRW